MDLLHVILAISQKKVYSWNIIYLATRWHHQRGIIVVTFLIYILNVHAAKDETQW